MKRFILSGIVATLAFVFTACGDDDGDTTPSHEIGEWDLLNYALLNVPSAYSNSEGRTLALNQVTLGITSYELDLEADGTFDRSIGIIGRLPDDDEGTWVLDDNDLTLDSEDLSDDEIFSVEKNEEDDLWLSVSLNFFLIPNTVDDTLTQAYFNSLTEEEQDALFDPVPVDFTFVFERD